MTSEELIASIKGSDEKKRGEAWQQAGEVGSAAVKPLAALVVGTELEVGRAAKRAIWQIVRHAGRPGADSERQSVVTELLAVLDEDRPPLLRREVMWMLSELAGDEAVPALANRLTDPELREDARMTLQRIPGQASLAALKAALAGAPADFRPNLAQSLRQRGVEVAGVPCMKLVPVKKTRVQRPASRPA